MKILKRILIVIVVLAGVILITALFVKKEMKAEREVIINKPKAEVYEYVKYLKNQKEFSKWASLDPNMKVSYTGTDATPGFVYAWDSNNDEVGKGEQEIKAISPDKIDYELRFIKPWKSVAASSMIVEDAGNNQTRVKWGFEGSMAYPFNVIRLFMDMDKAIGDDFQTGLNNLKAKMEKQ